MQNELYYPASRKCIWCGGSGIGYKEPCGHCCGTGGNGEAARRAFQLQRLDVDDAELFFRLSNGDLWITDEVRERLRDIHAKMRGLTLSK